MDIKILEVVCWAGSKLEPIVDEALTRLDLDYDFEIIGELIQIVKLGVTNPPALMINGNVELSGKVPTVEEVMEVLKKYE